MPLASIHALRTKELLVFSSAQSSIHLPITSSGVVLNFVINLRPSSSWLARPWCGCLACQDRCRSALSSWLARPGVDLHHAYYNAACIPHIHHAPTIPSSSLPPNIHFMQFLKPFLRRASVKLVLPLFLIPLPCTHYPICALSNS